MASLALTVALAVAAEPAPVDLPRIGEPADVALSPLEEQRIGSKITAELYARDYILEDAEVTEYVAALTWRLVASAEAEPPDLTVFVMKDPRINAFALPGGFLGVNAGLLTTVRNESELAGVLAHELAHVTQRHIARTIEGTQTANIATWAAVLAAILAASANPEVVIAALSLGQAANYQRQVNFTRAHELEADRIGIRTMSRARFDPLGVAAFFVRLEQQSRLYGNQIPEFLRTHPVNTTRISEARMRAAALPAQKVVDPLEFSLMQARARALTTEPPSQAAEHFLGEIGKGSGDAGHRYGLAIAQAKLGEYDRALATLKPTLAQYPRQPNLAMLEARILLAKGQGEAALERVRRALDHYPRYAPAVLEYADMLLGTGQPDAARQLLLSREQSLGTRMETHRLLAYAARDAGQTVEAQFQMANYLFERGDAGGALAQLDAALRTSSLSSQERSRLRARRSEIVASSDELTRRQQRPPPEP
ncbi:MAG TPA: M48 family metalloprotease [Verrucomicrobiae bacterium]|nr:M48 family metalloprotease [Verrucomicrobiae bacterium]